jgi:hypothetical protein
MPSLSPEIVDNSSYVMFPTNIVTDSNCDVFVMYVIDSDDDSIGEIIYRKRSSGIWGSSVNLSPDKAISGYDQSPGQIYIDNKGNVVFTWMGKGYGAHTGVYHPVYRYLSPSGTIFPAITSDATDMFPDDDTEMIYPCVFWHYYPLIDSVFHNLVTSGLSFVYLYNPRNGASKDTADLKFYSSPNALVGDVGVVGVGGSGIGDFTPSGISAESILQSDSFSTVLRGYIGKSPFNRTAFGNYLV